MKRLSSSAPKLAEQCKELETTVQELREELNVFDAHLKLAKDRLSRLCEKRRRGRPPKNPIFKSDI